MGDLGKSRPRTPERHARGAADTDLISREKHHLVSPPMYQVIILNDDYTPMDFVVSVLEKFFHKSHDEAVEVMWRVHKNGVGLCGIYTHEIAETKVHLVTGYSKDNGHPLLCTMEEAPS